MVNIKIVCVGKLKETYHKDAVNEYTKRLSRFAKIKIIEVEDEKLKENASIKEEQLVLQKEGQRIISQIKDDEFVFLLDLHGKEISSEDLALKMKNTINNYSTISFVIGGSLGLSDEVRNRSDFALKLSPMTFTHQMTRIIILEQIYRTFKINSNQTYHK